MLDLLRRYTAIKQNIGFREAENTLLNNDWLNKGMLYSRFQQVNAFKNIKNAFIGIDEGYLVADKRESMSYINILYTKAINIFASNNNIIFTNIQDLTDLDTRIVRKAHIIFVIKRRGLAYTYVKQNNLPIIHQQSIFDLFERNPSLLTNGNIADAMLKRIKGFVGITKWKDLKRINSPLYVEYAKIKMQKQQALDLGQF